MYDAIEEEFDLLASRLAEDVDLELEGIYRRADQRLEEVFARCRPGRAGKAASGVPYRGTRLVGTGSVVPDAAGEPC